MVLGLDWRIDDRRGLLPSSVRGNSTDVEIHAVSTAFMMDNYKIESVLRVRGCACFHDHGYIKLKMISIDSHVQIYQKASRNCSRATETLDQLYFPLEYPSTRYLSQMKTSQLD